MLESVDVFQFVPSVDRMNALVDGGTLVIAPMSILVASVVGTCQSGALPIPRLLRNVPAVPSGSSCQSELPSEYAIFQAPLKFAVAILVRPEPSPVWVPANVPAQSPVVVPVGCIQP